MNLAVVSDEGDLVRVRVTGEVNQKEINNLSEPISSLLGGDAYQRSVLLDMSEVQMIDSAGVGWLLNCNKQFKDDDGKLVLHSLSLLARNVFRVLNMHLVFNISADENEAVHTIRDKAS
jgi:anti-anti-sigma factor